MKYKTKYVLNLIGTCLLSVIITVGALSIITKYMFTQRDYDYVMSNLQQAVEKMPPTAEDARDHVRLAISRMQAHNKTWWE